MKNLLIGLARLRVLLHTNLYILALAFMPTIALSESADNTVERSTIINDDRCSAPENATNSKAADYRLYSGWLIKSIRHKSIDVFDVSNPKEDNWLYGLFNRFHINTRTNVIKRQLLFSEGEKLSVGLTAESERLLRSRGYLGDARILVDEVCDDGLALLVVTRDIWTTEPESKLSRQGGENEVGFGLKEGNIGGTGSVFQVGYYKDSNRSSIDYGFHSPHIFNTRLALDVTFSETSDGQQSDFSLERPFFSLSTPWSAGFSFGTNAVRESIRYLDDERNNYRHQQEYREVFSGVAISANDEYTQRVTLGFRYDAQDFEVTERTQSEIPESYTRTYPWIEYQYLEKVYAVYNNLNLMHQTEDVAVGADLHARLGYAGSGFDNEIDSLLYEVGYTDALGLGPHHLIEFSAQVDGQYYLDDHQLGESMWGGTLGYHALFGSKHRWYSSISYFNGQHLLQHNELTAGGITGLRGYPLDYQRGDQKYVFTLEKRYISDLHIFNLIRVGFVTYLDIGKAWGANYPGASQLADIGIGLRFSSSKAKVGTVLHIDLARPLVDTENVDSYQLVLKGSQSL